MAVDDGRVVSNFIIQALRNENLTIFGDGSQTRSFCYVDDLVDGILKLSDHDCFQGPVNLGNDAEFTVKELAEKVIDITGSKSRLVFMPLPQDDPKIRRPDLSLANDKLDYQPQTPLELGLKKTIAYFDKALSR